MKNSRKLLSGIFVVGKIYFVKTMFFVWLNVQFFQLKRVLLRALCLRVKFVSERIIFFANGGVFICFQHSLVPRLTATESDVGVVCNLRNRHQIGLLFTRDGGACNIFFVVARCILHVCGILRLCNWLRRRCNLCPCDACDGNCSLLMATISTVQIVLSVNFSFQSGNLSKKTNTILFCCDVFGWCRTKSGSNFKKN